MKSTRRIVTAALVFLALLLIQQTDRLIARRAADMEQAQKRVVLLKDHEVNAVEIRNRYGLLRFARVDGEWRMTEPVATRADQLAVDTMLRNLAGATRRHAFSTRGAPDLTVYGFDKTGATTDALAIAIEGQALSSEGKPISSTTMRSRLILGGVSSTGDYYATLEGADEEVFTVQGYLRNLIDRDVIDFRDRSIAPTDPNTTLRFAIQTRDSAVRLERMPGGGWWMTAPFDCPADKKRVEDLLNKINRASIALFEDTPTSTPAQVGLEPPSVTLNVTAEIGATAPGKGVTTRTVEATFEIGRHDMETQTYFARVAGAAGFVRVPESLYDDLTIPPGELRQRELFDFALADVARIEARMGESHVVLTKDADGKWRFEDDPSAPVNQERARRLVNDLAFLEATRFLDDAPATASLRQYGLAPPLREFIITTRPGRGAPQVHWVQMGANAEGVNLFYAQASSSPAPMTIQIVQPRQFLVTKEGFLERRLMPDLEAATVGRIELALDGTTAVVTLGAARDWQLSFAGLTAPAARKTVAKEKVDALMAAVEDLAWVERLAADDPRARLALERPVDLALHGWRRGAEGESATAPAQFALRVWRPVAGAGATADTVLICVGQSDYYLVFSEAADAVRSAAERIVE